MKKYLSLLLVLLVITAVVPALASGDSPFGIAGTNAATTMFYVQSSGYNAGLSLSADMGVGYVSHGSTWSRPGNWDESLYGFFRVTVTGASGTDTYLWVPSADSTLARYNSDWHTGTDLTISFPGSGVYTVTVASIVASDYLNDAYVRSWRQNPTWALTNQWSCSASYSYPSVTPAPTSAPVSGTASKLTLSSTYTTTGQVSGTITRYTTGVTHTLEWTHRHGETYTESLGTSYGSFTSILPASWPAGYVDVTLTTTRNGVVLGRSQGTVYLSGTSRVTATPTAAPSRASSITINQRSVTAGGTVTIVITRFDTTVTHKVNWRHQNGSSFTTDFSSRYGTLAAQIPSYWPAGTVTATLYTYRGSSLVGTSSATFQVASAVTATPTAAPRASTIRLTQTTATAGSTVSAYITAYTAGVTHTLLWRHQNGTTKTTSLGSSTGTVSDVIPSNWPAGTVTVTLYTYLNGTSLGTGTATLTLRSAATATPSAVASAIRLNQSYATAGSTVSAVITRYTAGVTHSIVWDHQSGYSVVTSVGSSYGTVSQTIPSNWPAGTVTATLYTYYNGMLVGFNTATLTITGAPTATPMQRASALQLKQSSAMAGTTINAVVTRYTTGVTHGIYWQHQNGSSFYQDLGTASGTVSCTIPANWTTGTVTATLYTYYGSQLLGTSQATLYITAAATATPVPQVSMLQLKQSSVVAGGTISAVITRYTVGATHSIVWQHQNGASFQSDYGTKTGTVSATIPTGWSAGTVTATLYTYVNGYYVGTDYAVFQVTRPVTATPAPVASGLTLQSYNVDAGSNVTAVITSFTANVTHTIIWNHEDGSSFSSNLGTTTGARSITIPSGWKSGNVTAVLYTYYGGTLVGTDQANLYVNGKSAGRASELTLYNTKVQAGDNIAGYVNVYTSGVNHNILWSRSSTDRSVTTWGGASGGISFNVPSGWANGTVTVTLYTYLNGDLLGTSTATFTIQGPTPAPTAKPTSRPTATPGNNLDLNALKAAMINPTAIQWQKPGDGTYGQLEYLDAEHQKRLTDFDRSTGHYYTAWTRFNQDDVPELRFSFSNETMRSVWIRPGKRGQDFYDYAFPLRTRVVVYCDQGTLTFEYKFNGSPSYGVTGYQRIDLGQQLTGVWQIDMYFPEYKVGQVHTNAIMIGDVAFCNLLPGD